MTLLCTTFSAFKYSKIYRAAQKKTGLFTFVVQVLYFYNKRRKYD